ncbi:hypothetical protein BN1423_1070049 [Carnobacterium maltaromaticum]|nr:hypothetical protein BN1423_1070049 [Carnobacterium maltaromaticum]
MYTNPETNNVGNCHTWFAIHPTINGATNNPPKNQNFFILLHSPKHALLV